MLVWFALLIPIAATFIIWKRWPHEIAVWELIAPVGVCVLLIGLTQFALIQSQTKDSEYWGGIVTKAEYYERWNERVPCTHYEYCETCTTDSRGNQTCTSYVCGTMHPYDVDNHPPKWLVHNTNGETIRINKTKFRQLVSKFGNKSFVDLHRDYHTIDGDKYVSVWPETDETAEVMTTHHTYENRIQTSRSVFNYPKVTPEEQKQYGLYQWPSIRGFYDRPAILGRGGPTMEEAQREFQLLNGYLGRKKQLRIWVLIFQNQPRDAGHMQEAMWIGGNKNEFVITVGVDDEYHVEWAHVFSWTKKERLKIDTRYFLEEQDQLDLVALADWLRPRLNKRFVRRPFAEFDYIKVSPPTWGIILIYVLTLLASVGISWYAVANQIRD